MTIIADLHFALRSLRRSPGFAAIAILTLGLGIGANTAAFSIVNEVLLRPLPYPDSGQLDRIYRVTPQNSRGAVSPADYLDVKAEMNGYGKIAAYAFTDMNLSAPGEPADTAAGLRISANLFSTLGVEPQLGRGFRPDETVSGNHRVLILSHRFWQDRFGSESACRIMKCNESAQVALRARETNKTKIDDRLDKIRWGVLVCPYNPGARVH